MTNWSIIGSREARIGYRKPRQVYLRDDMQMHVVKLQIRPSANPRDGGRPVNIGVWACPIGEHTVAIVIAHGGVVLPHS